MKETKVYVDDETLMKCERYRHNNCPIIQTHDRELVKEVCEKITRNVRVVKIRKEWYAIETDLRAILDKMQELEGEDE